MSIHPIKEVKGKIVPIITDDIDTDRIIPARYLKCVTFDGLGEFAFHDDRYDNQGNKKEHPLNDKSFQNASIILSGANFGCGSSREHAPQAIKRAGFNAVIAESFAEIFHGNATMLGIVCITLEKNEITELAEFIEQNPDSNVTVDIASQKLITELRSYSFGININAKKDFLSGTYDSLAELISNIEKVKKFEESLPYRFSP